MRGNALVSSIQRSIAMTPGTSWTCLFSRLNSRELRGFEVIDDLTFGMASIYLIEQRLPDGHIRWP
jgi:hypothetical protein